MRNISSAFVTAFVLAQILILSASSQAAAISAELAKKCRGMAIKAHPPTQIGTTPYAAAERDFFRDCVSKNGDMPDSDKDDPQSGNDNKGVSGSNKEKSPTPGGSR
jgi:hypothetical protein